jgi:outer membrane protein with beta-barrel domain
MSRAVAMAAVLTPTLVSASLAQRRAAAEAGVTRRDVLSARVTSPSIQQPQGSAKTTGPDWSAFAGVASGDNPYDIGIALGAAGKWHRSDWPVAVRGDAYFAHHSGDIGGANGGFDVSINMFGIMGGAEYSFPTENKLKPYAFGGLGLFYSNVDVDVSGPFEDSAYDSSTDLGFGIGGGIHFTSKFGIELRFMDIGGFNTIPILAAFHF